MNVESKVTLKNRLKRMIKALFLDVDGTLVSFDTHKIPQSAINAIKLAHDKGVKIIIATGRCRRIINNLTDIEPYIDGYSCTNGAYNIIGNKEVSFYPIDDDDVRKVLAKAEEANVACIVSGKQNVTCVNRNEIFHKVFVEMHNISYFAEELPSLESVLAEGVSEFTPFFSKQTEEELMAELDNCECSRWYPAFMDITRKGVNKGLAVKDVAEFLGISIAETMAIGDGDNDVPMLQKAGIGIAMGNSTDDVKSKADDITDDIDNDGLSKALMKYGVI